MGLPALSLSQWFLVGARLGPLALIAPWLALPGTSGLTRGGITLTLSLALAGVAAPSAVPLRFPVGVHLFVEGLIGTAFAVAVSTPLFALSWGGAWIDGLRSGTPPRERSPSAGLLLLAGAALFWASGAHRLALRAFADSLSVAPIGGWDVQWGDVAMGTARLIADAFAVSVSVAAPAIAALLLVEAALQVVGRPGGFAALSPLRALVSMAGLLLALPWALEGLGAALEASIGAAAGLLR